MDNFIDVRRQRIESLLEDHSVVQLHRSLGVDDGFLQVALEGGNQLWPADVIEKLDWLYFLTATRRALKWAVVNAKRRQKSRWHKLVAGELVVRLELVLLTIFSDTLPEPGLQWGDGRRSREIELRQGRLKWYEENCYGGWKNWLLDRSRQKGLTLQRAWLEEFVKMRFEDLSSFWYPE